MVNITASLNSSANAFTHPQHSKSTIASLIIMAVVIFIENVTVCALFAANQKLRITTNVFVISLAISDLFVAILFVPVYLSTPVSHQANPYVVTFLLFTSLFNLCGVTYDRYHAILQPLTYRTVLTTWWIALLLFAIWFVPVLLIILPVAWSGQDLKTRRIIDRVYIGFMVLVVFAACVVISKVYFSIFKAIRRQLRMTRYVKGMFGPSEISSIGSFDRQSCSATTVSIVRAESPNISPTLKEERPSQEFEATLFGSESIQSNTHPRKNLRRLRMLRLKKYTESVFNDVRAVKLFAIVILVFVICWLPAIIINFMVAINELASTPQFIFDISVFAFVANAIVNPLLFTFYKRDYRKALMEIIACKACKDSQNKSVISFDAFLSSTWL